VASGLELTTPDEQQRPGQPAEPATIYVMLAFPLSSYVSDATTAVTGGKPMR
jgi:NAD(P)-dependent dehydrogenase (short-subunit alcohol dehydrogenase family)